MDLGLQKDKLKKGNDDLGKEKEGLSKHERENLVLKDALSRIKKEHDETSKKPELKNEDWDKGDSWVDVWADAPWVLNR